MTTSTPLKLFKKLLKKFTVSSAEIYDRQTAAVIKKVCKKNSNCIDVGGHKGKILKLMLKQSPNGMHFCFEPVPALYKGLKANFTQPTTKILNMALSDTKGETEFNFVVSRPAYSGIKKRKYPSPDEVVEKIRVQADTLDNVIPKEIQIDFIKIDVEGGELQVLKGGLQTLKRCKPFIVFEHGLDASDYYDTTPEKVYSLLKSCDLEISLLSRWLKGEEPLTLIEFEKQFHERKNYFFIAYPSKPMPAAISNQS